MTTLLSIQNATIYSFNFFDWKAFLIYVTTFGFIHSQNGFIVCELSHGVWPSDKGYLGGHKSWKILHAYISILHQNSACLTSCKNMVICIRAIESRIWVEYFGLRVLVLNVDWFVPKCGMREEALKRPYIILIIRDSSQSLITQISWSIFSKIWRWSKKHMEPNFAPKLNLPQAFLY